MGKNRSVGALRPTKEKTKRSITKFDILPVMMRTKHSLVLGIFALMVVFACDSPAQLSPASVEKSLCIQASLEPIKLKEVKLSFGIIQIPEGVELITDGRPPIDGPAWTFKGLGLSVLIDGSRYSGRPTFQRDYPSYSDEFLTVDGVKARMWSYEGNGVCYAGASYGTRESDRISMGISISSDTIAVRDVARLVLTSIKFNEK